MEMGDDRFLNMKEPLIRHKNSFFNNRKSTQFDDNRSDNVSANNPYARRRRSGQGLNASSAILKDDIVQTVTKDRDICSVKKRNLDIHFEDISQSCSLKSLYQTREVFQRSSLCTVIGVVLEIKDEELRELYRNPTDKQPPKFLL